MWEEENPEIEDDFSGYVEDTLADILWANSDLCEWFKYEGLPEPLRAERGEWYA